MNVKSFIKDKMLVSFLLLFAVITIEIFLIPYAFGNFIKVYIPISIFTMYIVGVSIEYFTKKNFYHTVENTLEELEEKYLITEIMRTPTFWEGKLLKVFFEQVNKSMVENVNKYKYMRGRL